MKLENYQDVMEHLHSDKRRSVNLLMGNGFSMAYDKNVFSYKALSQFIENLGSQDLKKLFNIIDTYNFEQIMKELGLFKKILEEFYPDAAVINKIGAMSAKLKKSLIEAVENSHPENVFSISEEKSTACSSFLGEFLKKDNKIFTTNYDLLLYWVLMRNTMENCGDGFGRDIENDTCEFIPEEDKNYSELRWGRNKATQRIFYLHGALHLFDTGTEVIKEEYEDKYLLEKIKERMKKSNYPIFVTAGDGKEKLRHIRHNPYLSNCYDELSMIKGSLITFGFNFGKYDNHIIDAINRAAKQSIRDRLRSVYIGVYSEEDQAHIEEIKGDFHCQKLHIFDAKTANVWG